MVQKEGVTSGRSLIERPRRPLQPGLYRCLKCSSIRQDPGVALRQRQVLGTDTLDAALLGAGHRTHAIRLRLRGASFRIPHGVYGSIAPADEALSTFDLSVNAVQKAGLAATVPQNERPHGKSR